MQSEGANLAANSRLKVSAIFATGQHKWAIINGKNYSEGQTVLGNKIVTIEQHRVVLSGHDGRKEFFINNNNVKKDVTNGF